MLKKTMETSTDMLKALAEFYGAAFKRPDQYMSQYVDFLKDRFGALARQSDIRPDRVDKRFSDPIWQSNPVYKTMMTSHLSCEAILATGSRGSIRTHATNC